jgi:hypothetical protein
MQENASADDHDVLRTVEAGIYERLTRPGEQRPWAISELVLEIGDPLGVEDTLAELHGSGLVHRCGEFVWASRAALAAEAIEL